jgi:phosphoenolpyruvate carboxykinase (GTP)
MIGSEPQADHRAPRGQGRCRRAPIGRVPTGESLDVDGLDLGRDTLEECLRVDPDEWRAEVPAITEWFDRFGDKLHTLLWAELDGLKTRLGLT